MSDCAPPDAERYFLSYSRSDQDFALRLAQDLRGQGVAIFVDQWDIRPSEHWDRAIERAVGCCRGLVVIISPRSVASDNVMDEISFAIDNRKSVLPVMIEKCVLPLRITRMHVVDATKSYDKALQQCLGELQRKDGLAPRTVEVAAPARVPLDPEAIASAKHRLAPIIGPIADILVDKAAARAGSLAELHDLLAKHIDKEEDRQAFMGSASHREPSAAKPAACNAQPTQGFAVPANELETMSSALTRYIGPIAPVVAKRESRACSSLDDLRHRLAALIPVDSDRAQFLQATGGAPAAMPIAATPRQAPA